MTDLDCLCVDYRTALNTIQKRNLHRGVNSITSDIRYPKCYAETFLISVDVIFTEIPDKANDRGSYDWASIAPTSYIDSFPMTISNRRTVCK